MTPLFKATLNLTTPVEFDRNLRVFYGRINRRWLYNECNLNQTVGSKCNDAALVPLCTTYLHRMSFSLYFAYSPIMSQYSFSSKTPYDTTKTWSQVSSKYQFNVNEVSTDIQILIIWKLLCICSGQTHLPVSRSSYSSLSTFFSSFNCLYSLLLYSSSSYGKLHWGYLYRYFM